MAQSSTPLYKMTKELCDTAMGRLPADLVIRGGKLVNVCTGEIQEKIDVVIRGGRIALVGDAGGLAQKAARVIDAAGRYLAPGFIDAHIHVESSMLTVSEFARAALPHGTSAIFMDPHEIVNVLGLDGMKAMMADGAATPLRVYITTPSCVPAADGLEETGSCVTAEDIASTMSWDGVAGLGEMMDFNGILNGDAGAHAKVAAALAAGKPATGHFPLGDTGARLNAYLASGIGSCHESVRAEEALAKMRLGAYAMLREGSAWDDLPEVIRAVTEHRVDSRYAVLVSDDLHAETLLSDGHIDRVVRMAIRHGVNPVTAVQMATLNAASCFGLAGELGSIAPGRLADINLLDDLAEVRVSLSVVGGEVVAENGALKAEFGGYTYPEAFLHSVHLPPLEPDDFAVRGTRAPVRVIEVGGGSSLTKEVDLTLPERKGELMADPAQDVCKVAVFNRHHHSGQKGLGFVKGFGLARGAVASTYAHDAHNLMVVGIGDEEMAFAAQTLLRCGGGLCAVADGKVLALVELPVAGLLSLQPAERTAKALRELEEAWRSLGCSLPSPFMTMSLLSLSVIPQLRITDKGLVDVLSGKLVPLAAPSGGKPPQA